MSIDELIEKYQIPDKPDFHGTTTHKFKKDIWNYFNKEIFNKLTFVEFGTSRGYTSLIMSYLFKKVHTINIQDSVDAKAMSTGIDNINYHIFDLYNFSPNNWSNIGSGDVFMIDAVHTYDAVMIDVNNALSLLDTKLEKKVFIFDDYGAYPEVKKAIDELISSKTLEVVMTIGEEQGYSYGERTHDTDRTLKSYEGLICLEV